MKSPTQKPLQKVLVANRGEIAMRVVRTCKKLGIRTVAVYSDADRGAPFVLAADEAVHIGPSPAKESYLVAEKILEAAKRSGADAVHPGYGFLSENAEFSGACSDAGLVFIGPRRDAVRLMGNKRQAKLRMIEAGVPCIPGYEGKDQSDDVLLREADRIGYPVMIKAAAGGGGRGMRLVHERSAFVDAARSARAEAENAFASSELILEKAVIGARHVEIQVFADAHGNVVHLGERDCSVQRRHQKVVEESPSPAVGPELRARMGDVAVKAAKAIDYLGAGTIEFLLSPAGEFYFMEMNTRLQVEHPVTEAITGEDLVEWQLRVAAGEPLPRKQEEIVFSGHAIEVRLCAEDPSREYMPQTGTIERLVLPDVGLARFDHALAEGRSASPFYDSMQGKLIAHGRTRDEARKKLSEALTQLAVLGVVTNKAMLLRVLDHPAFASGAYDTSFVPTHFGASVLATAFAPTPGDFAMAAAVLYRLEADALAARTGLPGELRGWNSALPCPSTVRLVEGDVEHVAHVTPLDATTVSVVVSGSKLVATVVPTASGEVLVTVDDHSVRVRAHLDGARLWLDAGDVPRVFEDVTYRGKGAADGEGDGTLTAPIDGKVLRVAVSEGDVVKKGQLVVALEAMKMEFLLTAPFDGTIASIGVSASAQVGARAVLAVVKKAEPAAG